MKSKNFNCYESKCKKSNYTPCRNMNSHCKDKSSTHYSHDNKSNFEESCPCQKHNSKNSPLAINCSLRDVAPAILPLPFPESKVEGSNCYYAELLSQDYCGLDSELTAIMQYVNHETLLTHSDCMAAQTLLAISQAEMIHLQKLGELIVLLGGKLDFKARKNKCGKNWTPAPIALVYDFNEIIMANIKGERAAIKQYEDHIRLIKDSYITDMLKRIVKDEKYHILLLKDLLKNECN